jgi:quercetin dioxygenase-like cupin family protein
MKRKVTVASVISGFILSYSAHALEPSSSVMAFPVLEAETSWDGKPILYPEGKAKVTGMIIEIAPGAETGWHLHPVSSFGMLLEGELEVRLKTGETKKLNAGEALAEVTNTLHNGRNVGLVPVKIVVFYAGVAGQKLSVKEGDQ